MLYADTKKKKETTKSEESSLTGVTEHRENLTERLKREFGFDDDSEGISFKKFSCRYFFWKIKTH